MKLPLAGATLAASVGLAVVFGTTSRISRQENKATNPPHRPTWQEKIKEKLGKPTLIQEGVMTDKQKKHSKIFKRFELTTGGKKVRDIIAGKDEVYLVKTVPDGFVTEVDLTRYLTALGCKADAVFVGTVSSKSSQLLEEGTFTFTDYELSVNDVFKNNPLAVLHAADVVTYTSPGGSVELNGTIINAVDYRSEPLQIGGQYLFYATLIPETGSYKNLSSSLQADTFQLANGVVTQMSEKPFPLAGRSLDANQFIGTVRSVMSGPCQK